MKPPHGPPNPYPDTCWVCALEVRVGEGELLRENHGYLKVFHPACFARVFPKWQKEKRKAKQRAERETAPR